MLKSDSYKIVLSHELVLCSAEGNPEFYLVDPKTGGILKTYKVISILLFINVLKGRQ